MSKVFVWAAMVALAGCASYETAEAGGRPGDPPFDSAGVEARCLSDAHTIVVGPEPGCAELVLDTDEGSGFVRCPGLAPEGLDLVPIRVVRRGSGPVRLSLRSDPAQYGPPRLLPASTSYSDACCSVPFPVRGAERSELDEPPSHPRFDDWAIDGSVELLVPRTSGDVKIRACVLEDTPTRREYRSVCRAACESDVECGFVEDLARCLLRCDGEAGRQTNACLDARLEGMACESEHLPRCRESLTGDANFTACPSAAVAEGFECLEEWE